MYRDARLAGFDAAAVVEVIEHLDPSRLEAFERMRVRRARPRPVVLTTPNAEYNVRCESCRRARSATATTASSGRAPSSRRGRGRRRRYGYARRASRRRAGDPEVGAPTQMAVFTRDDRRIPELSLVVPVGASGSGKSTFAAPHFKPTEILSSDFCRGLVSRRRERPGRHRRRLRRAALHRRASGSPPAG